jgi:low affinity Fe/Cu permease
MGYSLQGNRKVKEGRDHPDRDAQFNFINNKVKKFQTEQQPVISVDTKKKENIGNFKNTGHEYCKKGNPTEVKVYDFIDPEKGKAAPYGIYDITKNNGWVSVGISSDTAQFAVNSIRSWWQEMGKNSYPEAKELYINADGGGSNGSRVRLWKIELQKLANELDKIIHVSHFPPGTSKWNKIEHKMFCFISKNWRGRPLVDTATIVNLIGNTSTKSGLKIKAKLDDNIYQKGIKISNRELETIAITKNTFHGEWNYQITPQN